MTITRIMGIDYGSVRIGLALSDPLQIISRPFLVIPNEGDNTFEVIKKIISEQAVSRIIVGLPLDKDGSDSDKTREVRNFTSKLKVEISVPIELWDERYTSAAANSFLKEIGVDYKKSKTMVDKVAAAIILKDYMESRR